MDFKIMNKKFELEEIWIGMNTPKSLKNYFQNEKKSKINSTMRFS